MTGTVSASGTVVIAEPPLQRGLPLELFRRDVGGLQDEIDQGATWRGGHPRVVQAGRVDPNASSTRSLGGTARSLRRTWREAEAATSRLVGPGAGTHGGVHRHRQDDAARRAHGFLDEAAVRVDDPREHLPFLTCSPSATPSSNSPPRGRASRCGTPAGSSRVLGTGRTSRRDRAQRRTFSTPVTPRPSLRTAAGRHRPRSGSRARPPGRAGRRARRRGARGPVRAAAHPVLVEERRAVRPPHRGAGLVALTMSVQSTVSDGTPALCRSTNDRRARRSRRSSGRPSDARGRSARADARG